MSIPALLLVAAILHWFIAVGFGVFCVPDIRNLLSGRDIPIVMGFPAYGRGPFERLGTPDDVVAAVSVYEPSNLARRQGDWPSRSARVAQVTASLHDDTSWFLIGRDGAEAVAMVHMLPFRAGGGTGQVIPGTSFLNLIYVLPDHWGKGIGGTMLDAVIDEAARRGCHRIYLWTHEHQNERAHRLYQSRRFAPTGRTSYDTSGKSIGEWLRDG